MNHTRKTSKRGHPNLFRVLYEDDSITAVFKASGCLSQADVTGDPDLLTLLKERYRNTANQFAGLVHRLDRPACGIMIFARTPVAAANLSRQLREHRFHKTYLAVVHGKPSQEAVLEDSLVIGRENGKTVISKNSHQKRLTAELHYRLLDTHLSRSLLEVQLFTGRKHQIRAQLAERGFPIVGDRKYGSREVLRNPGMIALCAWKLQCIHPEKKYPIQFHSPRPQHWPWHDPDLFEKAGKIKTSANSEWTPEVESNTFLKPVKQKKRPGSKRSRD
jgi:23S rRNA pseudouridine1911/1915/1917 synthase